LAPQAFFSKRTGGWASFLKRAEAAGGAVIFLDYDGTLVPLRRRPEDAVLAPSSRKLLETLAGRPGISVQIVTGRSMADIQDLVPVKNVGFAADHGFEILMGNAAWRHPAARDVRLPLRDVSRRLRRILAGVRGVVMEEKGVTMSVHYRKMTGLRVGALRKAVDDAVSPYRRLLRVRSGKKVFEIGPDVPWDKGRAAVKMLEMLGVAAPAPVLYIGDDRTDEDAFRALAAAGYTVKVGRSRASRARYFLEDPARVRGLLRRILQTLPSRT